MPEIYLQECGPEFLFSEPPQESRAVLLMLDGMLPQVIAKVLTWLELGGAAILCWGFWCAELKWASVNPVGACDELRDAPLAEEEAS